MLLIYQMKLKMTEVYLKISFRSNLLAVFI